MGRGKRQDKNISDEEVTPTKLRDDELQGLQANVITAPLDWHPTLKLVSITPLKTHPDHSLVKWPLLRWEFVRSNSLWQNDLTGPIFVRVPPSCEINRKQAQYTISAIGKYADVTDIPNDDLSVLFADMRSRMAYYLWFPEDGWYDVITAWTIGTYFFPAFQRFPALVLQGMRETGKTTTLRVLSHLVWNPTGILCSLSPAAMFREAQDSRKTFLIDKSRIVPENETDLLDLYEAGTEKDGEVKRVAEDKLTIQTFNVYSPKAIAVREDPPFLVKAVRITMQKAPSIDYGIRIHELENDKEIERFQELLLLYQWNAGNDIYREYLNQKPDGKFYGRPFDYAAPLLAIVSFFAPEIYDPFRSFLAEKMMHQEATDTMTIVEDDILEILLDFEGDQLEYRHMDLYQKVKEREDWLKNHLIIRHALNNLGIIIRSYKTSKGLIYVIDLKKARAIAAQRGIQRNGEKEGE